MEAIDKLAQKAVELQPLDRIKLVETILNSLEKIDEVTEQKWVAESEARYDAYRRKELEATDWDEIKKKYE